MNYLFRLLLIKFKGLFPVRFKTFLKKFKEFNGYDGLDRSILKYLKYKNGFYIECGANDGVNQSNTWYFEKSLNWKGVLIEPVQKVFQELKKNRSKKNFFFNTALVSFKYKKKFLYLNCDYKDTLISSSTKKIRLNKKIKVKVSTLNYILKQINAPKEIDFFSLDVEGDELNVLNGINFKKYTFKYILIESNLFKTINIFLNKHGYKFVKKISKGNDYLFTKKKKFF